MSEVIYLVSRGSYSDYTVYAAFTSEAAASAAIEAHAAAETYEPFFVETVPMNPDVLSNGKPAWGVHMDYDTGDNAEAGQLGLSEIIGGLDDDQVFRRFRAKELEIFWCQCWADDDEHAIKIANERRVQHKAMKGAEHE